jgi:hypothetical protein
MTGLRDSGLLVRTAPRSRFPLQVVQRDGLPEMPLTVFADELRRMLSPGSAYAYRARSFCLRTGPYAILSLLLTDGVFMESPVKSGTSSRSI